MKEVFCKIFIKDYFVGKEANPFFSSLERFRRGNSNDYLNKSRMSVFDWNSFDELAKWVKRICPTADKIIPERDQNRCTAIYRNRREIYIMKDLEK